ncbi:glycosyltransferase family 4 protein [Butyrivibrio fibrisolvens]|uniref:glycosyltransferase family 4 protein n=1 Tax=Butyrivibrio fibrisolvens TaxID=831 RepID=UPI0003B66719|nr:glycosyltransferase family 4 protein [Butyrivibrio fibrisolvens]
MKKYLIVLTSLELGGAERQALNFVDYLLNNNNEVEVVGFCNPGKIIEICRNKGILCSLLEDTRGSIAKKIAWRIDGVRGDSAEVSNYKYLSKLVARYIEVHKIDSCISYCSPANTIACYAKKYYPKCKYSWYQRDDGLCYEPYELRDKALHIADNVLSNGISGQKWIMDKHNVIAGVIHNGVRLQPQKQTASEWKIRLGLADENVVCTMIAHFNSTKKNHYQNVRTIKALVDDGYKQVVMLFAGRPDERDYYDDIVRYVNENQLENNVRFLNEVDDITGLLSITDICFFGTNREGNPNGVIEAALFGLPVVASDLPEIREVVSYDSIPYLFKNDDIDYARDCIKKLVDNPALRCELGSKNKEKALEEFTPEKNFKRLMDIT